MNETITKIDDTTVKVEYVQPVEEMIDVVWITEQKRQEENRLQLLKNNILEAENNIALFNEKLTKAASVGVTP